MEDMKNYLKNDWNLKIYFKPGSHFYEKSDEVGQKVMAFLQKEGLKPRSITICNKDE